MALSCTKTARLSFSTFHEGLCSKREAQGCLGLAFELDVLEFRRPRGEPGGERLLGILARLDLGDDPILTEDGTDQEFPVLDDRGAGGHLDLPISRCAVSVASSNAVFSVTCGFLARARRIAASAPAGSRPSIDCSPSIIIIGV